MVYDDGFGMVWAHHMNVNLREFSHDTRILQEALSFEKTRGK